MEESNLEQHGIITGLEHTCQDLKGQHVLANIKFDRKKKGLTIQIQDLKGQYETT
jgi:hypothetical protein